MLDLTLIPISAAAQGMAQADPNGPTALARALADGEDFELLLAMPLDEAQRLVADQPLSVPVTIVGSCINQPGLWQAGLEGELIPHDPLGYEHS
jgi:thiamine-monophosphate kinase